MMALYESVLASHLSRVQTKQIFTHCMSKTIQDEFIDFLGNKILYSILEHVKGDGFYSIILDCTPDINPDEQTSLVLRHVYTSTDNEVVVYEHFTGFLKVEKSTGLFLTNVLLERLKEFERNIMDCKGQGYDNGANLAGKHNGVQSRILEINQPAHFVPCRCHSLNLIFCDCAKTNVTFFSFFGTLQKLFSKLSSSTRRWKILKDNCSFVFKYPSDTRWENRINSVKVLFTNLSDIIKTLLLILQDISNAAEFRELNGILIQLTRFDSIASCIIWYNVLSQVNFVSCKPHYLEFKIFERMDLKKC